MPSVKEGVIVVEDLEEAKEKSQLPPSQARKSPSYENPDSELHKTNMGIGRDSRGRLKPQAEAERLRETFCSVTATPGSKSSVGFSKA